MTAIYFLTTTNWYRKIRRRKLNYNYNYNIIIIIIVVATLRCFRCLRVSWLKSKLSLVQVFLSSAPGPCMWTRTAGPSCCSDSGHCGKQKHNNYYTTRIYIIFMLIRCMLLYCMLGTPHRTHHYHCLLSEFFKSFYSEENDEFLFVCLVFFYLFLKWNRKKKPIVMRRRPFFVLKLDTTTLDTFRARLVLIAPQLFIHRSHWPIPILYRLLVPTQFFIGLGQNT